VGRSGFTLEDLERIAPNPQSADAENSAFFYAAGFPMKTGFNCRIQVNQKIAIKTFFY